MLKRVVFSLFALTAVAACSGEDETGENEGKALCAEDCDAIARAACPSAGSREDCVENCLGSYAKCPDEVKATVECGPEYACDADGNPFPEGCDVPLNAFQSCFNN